MKGLGRECKNKDCEDLIPWLPSISNAIWYAIGSSKGDHFIIMETNSTFDIVILSMSQMPVLWSGITD